MQAQTVKMVAVVAGLVLLSASLFPLVTRATTHAAISRKALRAVQPPDSRTSVPAAPEDVSGAITGAMTTEGTKSAAPGALLAYSIKDVGRYRTYPGRPPYNTDPAAAARPVVIRSLRTGSIRLTTTRQPNGGRAYTVTGQAQQTPGIYLDTWATYSTAPAGASAGEDVERFVQGVIIDANQLRTGTASLSPVPARPQETPPSLTQIPRAYWTARETASSSLRPKLMRLLTPQQRLDLKNGQEVLLPIPSLPASLRPEAVNYVRSSVGGTLQIGAIARAPEFSLVILPPPASTLGIDTVPDPGGNPTHF